ncbi:molybdopterin-dependent oxidoreductase [Ilumatobacter sp.]|uniref:molybdopterin-dependent oxidoreductase n=1 Tax=Ilumatobacter sp. TaxID=1967498 RepID=UPI003B51FB24
MSDTTTPTSTPPPRPAPGTITAVGALVGVACAALALGVAELVAGIVATWRSPIFDVGDRVIDLAPSFVTKFAIDVFGTNDKPALLIGIGVVLALYSMVVGALAFRRGALVGVIGFALFGAIGMVAVLTKSTSPQIAATTPIIVGTVIGAAALAGAAALLVAHEPPDRRAARSDTDDGDATVDGSGAPTTTDDADDVDPDADVDRTPVAAGAPRPSGTRRQFFAGAGVAVGVFAIAGGVTGAIGRSIRSRFSAADSRAALRLPQAASPLAEAPGGASVDVEGVSELYTPNETFYRIDTALTVPQLRTEDYRLAVTGMVDRTLDLSFDDLLRREVVEHDITLTCVSNTVGGELVGNARWLGIRLDDLLADAGVSPDATQVVGRSVDGYTCGFPIEAATDGRNAMVAFGMNGEPLPLEHGFPVRLVVPGLYGYISATKWLTEIELTTFEDFEQYWVPRGYADRAPIKMQSRIDSVDGLSTLELDADGQAAIGGVAWAQTRGISAVEVRIDDGEWERAELGEALNDDTWRQWAYRWTPGSTGRVEITTRAVDGDGNVQTEERADPLPDGASGWHKIIVFAP